MARNAAAAAGVLAALLVLALSGASDARPDEPTSKRARAARTARERAAAAATRAFQTQVTGAQRAYLRALDDAQKATMRGGQLDEARRIADARTWLEDALKAAEAGQGAAAPLEDERAFSSDAARDAQRDYQAALRVARGARRDALLAAATEYRDALKEVLDATLAAAKDLAEAERLAAAVERADADLASLRASEAWVVLFRSRHPEDWDTARDEPERFATPLAQAPRDLRWLRLRRVDTSASVIVALRHEQLGRDAESGRFGWVGGKAVRDGGAHLGIDNEAWALTFRDGGRIMVGKRSTSGWGFGHKVHANDAQYWAWAGQEIDACAFEVAVTSRDLTVEERPALLEDGSY